MLRREAEQSTEIDIPNKEIAPSSLVRTGPPTVLFDGLFAEIDDTSHILPLIQERQNTSTLKSHHVDARTVLSIALKTPKCIVDEGGMWFHELPREMLSTIGMELFGRNEMKNQLLTFTNSRKHQFLRNAESWLTDISKASKYGSLWESGVIVVGANNNMTVMSVSNPWEHDAQNLMKPWHMKLSPDELRNFVGREEILGIFREMLQAETGSLPKSKAQSAFESTLSDVWWGQAMNINQILNWKDWQEYRTLQRKRALPSFARQVVQNLEAQTGVKEKHLAIAQAMHIFGYTVRAYPTSFPGAINLSLKVNPTDWLSENKIKQIDDQVYKDRDEATVKRWIETRDPNGIGNYDHRHAVLPRFSVHFRLADIIKKTGGLHGSVGVEMLVFSRTIGRDPEHEQTKLFVIGSPDDGSYWRWERKDRMRTRRPLTPSDWKIVEEMFNQAIARTEIEAEERRFKLIQQNAKDLLRHEMGK